MKGIIKEDVVNTTLEGYSINGVHVHKKSEKFAEANIGKEVEYELNYDGYRQHSAFTKRFFEKAIISLPVEDKK
jgi:hypothetical protein